MSQEPMIGMPAAWGARMSAFFGVGIQVILVLFACRLLMDSATRMVYPFIPQFAQGIGISIAGFSWLLFIRSLTGLLSPVLGLWADRYGRLRMMQIGLLLLAAGLLGMAWLPGWWAVIPIVIAGIGNSAFIPAQQAYLSDLVPYAQRGRAFVTVDLAFSIAGIVLVPLVGWGIAAIDWQAPLICLSMLCLVAAVLLWRQGTAHEPQRGASLDLGRMLALLWQGRVLAAVITGLLIFFAYGSFITVWSIWLSSDFRLDTIAIGLIATMIALTELVSVLISMVLIDRVGKQRSCLIGCMVALLALILLLVPGVQQSLPLTVVVLCILGGSCEFTIVSLFPLLSEQLPDARATLFSLVAFGISIGLAIASPVTVALWEHSGLIGIVSAAAISLILAFWLIRRVLREQSVSA